MNPSHFYYKTEDTPDANTYEICDLRKGGNCFLKVVFDKELEQVIISTPKEVYQGPIDLIQFSADTSTNISSESSERDFKDKLLSHILIKGLYNFRYNCLTNKYYLVDDNDNDVVEITKEEYIYIQKFIDKNVS